MMVVDTSAVIALMAGEPEAPEMERLLAASSANAMSAANVIEATTVAQRWGEIPATTGLDYLLRQSRIQVLPLDLDQMEIARAAYMRFGKGRGHPAQLNFGDCFTYALAKSLDAPLLFKGHDFKHTDIVDALSLKDRP